MAIGDYILCSKCECKLMYDGDRIQREWWSERFNEEPQIECPKCRKRQPLTEETLYAMAEVAWRAGWAACRDAEFVGEEAEDEMWGEQGANVMQNIKVKHGIGGEHD